MEEIIASISRIITEDKGPNDPTRPVSTGTHDILELTEVVDEDGSVARATSSTGDPNTASAGSADAVDSAVAGPGEAPKLGLPDAESGARSKPEIGHERILSAAASGAAAAAFAQLGALPRERRNEGELSLAGTDRILEDLVRNLLRPLLKTWLDENLPQMVERLVREEIARVVGEAGLG